MRGRARTAAAVVAAVVVGASAVAGIASAAGFTLTSRRLTVLSAPAPSGGGGTTAPNVMTLAVRNGTGGTVGFVERGDKVEVTYDPAMDTNTICAGWNGQIEGSNQARVTVQDGGTGNDTLVVQAIGSSSCAGAFRFGTVDLGHGGYVAGGSVVFQGEGTNKTTVNWDAAARKLTVVLGGAVVPSGATRGTVQTTTVPAPLPAVYTPAVELRDVNGKQPTGTGTTATTNGMVQF